MYNRKAVLTIAILFVVFVIVISMLVIDNMDNNIDVFSDEPVITYKVGHKVPGFETYKEIKMDISGMHIGGMTILAVIGSLIGYFAILFWMFVVWRVLLVIEKLSTTLDRLMQQKISDQQDRET